MTNTTNTEVNEDMTIKEQVYKAVERFEGKRVIVSGERDGEDGVWDMFTTFCAVVCDSEQIRFGNICGNIAFPLAEIEKIEEQNGTVLLFFESGGYVELSEMDYSMYPGLDYDKIEAMFNDSLNMQIEAKDEE